MGLFKATYKKRDPKTLYELKKITLEEWNKIPAERIKKTGLNYIHRVKKILEIGGARLEEFHLRQIRKELKEKGEDIENEDADNREEEEEIEEEDINIKEDDFEEIPLSKNEKLKMRIIYKDEKLNLLRKNQIRKLKKRIEQIKREAREKLKKVNQKSIKKIPGIVKARKEKKI